MNILLQLAVNDLYKSSYTYVVTQFQLLSPTIKLASSFFKHRICVTCYLLAVVPIPKTNKYTETITLVI